MQEPVTKTRKTSVSRGRKLEDYKKLEESSLRVCSGIMAGCVRAHTEKLLEKQERCDYFSQAI